MDTLRPLGFGELFDRAITLYVRNFWAFAAIAALEVIPAALMVYGGDLAKTKDVAMVARALRHQTVTIHAAPAVSAALSGIGIVLSLIVAPLVYAAIGRGAALALEGVRIDARSLIAVVIRRLPRILVVFLPLAGCAAALYLVYHAVQFEIAYATYRLAGLLAARAVMDGLFAVVLGVLIVVMLIVLFAIYAVAIEDAGPFVAIGMSWARLMTARTCWRAAAIWLSAALIALVARLIFIFVGVAAIAFGLLWADALVEAIGMLVAQPLIAAIVAVLYMDVRVRREGLDILQRIKPDMTVEHA